MLVGLRHRLDGAVPVKDEADLDPRGGPGGGSIKQASARKFPESPVGRTAIYGFVLCLAAGIGVAHILETVEPVTTVRQGSPFTAKHAVRARGHMQSICDMGTRTVGGHANEVLAVEYILRKLREVERMAAPGALVEIASHTSSGVSGVGELVLMMMMTPALTMLQFGVLLVPCRTRPSFLNPATSQAFNMDFIDGATNVYENVTNILCRFVCVFVFVCSFVRSFVRLHVYVAFLFVLTKVSQEAQDLHPRKILQLFCPPPPLSEESLPDELTLYIYILSIDLLQNFAQGFSGISCKRRPRQCAF